MTAWLTFYTWYDYWFSLRYGNKVTWKLCALVSSITRCVFSFFWHTLWSTTHTNSPHLIFPFGDHMPQTSWTPPQSRALNLGWHKLLSTLLTIGLRMDIFHSSQWAVREGNTWGGGLLGKFSFYLKKGHKEEIFSLLLYGLHTWACVYVETITWQVWKWKQTLILQRGKVESIKSFTASLSQWINNKASNYPPSSGPAA